MPFLWSGLGGQRRTVGATAHSFELPKSEQPFDVVRRQAALGKLSGQDQIAHLMTLRRQRLIVRRGRQSVDNDNRPLDLWMTAAAFLGPAAGSSELRAGSITRGVEMRERERAPPP